MFLELLKEALGQKPGYRFDTDELVGKSLIEKGIAKQIENDPLAPVVAKSMEAALKSISDNLQATIDATLKSFATELTKSRKNAIPAIFGQGGNGDPKKTFAHFTLAVRTKNHTALKEMGAIPYEMEVEGKASDLTTQVGETAAYLIPDETYGRVMQLVSEAGVVRKRAQVIPMGGKEIKIPLIDHTTAPSAGNSAFLGGVQMSWTEEVGSITQTNPKLKLDNLTNYELSGYIAASNTLQQSAKGLEAILMDLFAQAIAWYEDYAFLRGDGVAKPLGVIAWPGFISQARSAANAFALQDFANMLSRWVPNFSSSSACYVAHPTVLAKLFQMSDVAGNIIYINNAREKPQMMLGGLDLLVSEKVPSLNTLGDISLCDFSKYVIGDPQQVAVAYSEHVYFLNNKGCWRAISRVGGMPWLKDKITLADASSTISPFVGLTAG